MSSTVISVENLSKVYRLGQIGTGTLSNDLKVWWARARGKPNPLLKIGQTDYGNVQGENLWALRDVSFKVEQGEVLGIIGRNGAGKSTLLKILSRVTAPTSGVVKVKGRIASLLEVGTGFHPELTGRENIYLNGAILGMTREEVRRKFDEIVDFAGVEDFIDTPVKRYSSGMYVRLAFAVAAHLESEILLVDEVLAVGDAEFQKKSLGKMGDVASKEGRTVLFVSHNMASVQNLCQTGILLDKGIIIFSGNAETAIDIYRKTTYSQESIVTIDELRTMSEVKIIKDVKVNKSNSGILPKLNIGDDLLIEISLQKNNLLRKINIVIGIDNQFGQRIFTISTQNQNQKIYNQANKIRVECLIKDIKLYPGLYFFKIAVADDYRFIDIIESYPGFEVLPTDFYGSGKLPTINQGVILVDAEWNTYNE